VLKTQIYVTRPQCVKTGDKLEDEAFVWSQC